MPPERFESRDYHVLIVAEKYQTGFDQQGIDFTFTFDEIGITDFVNPIGGSRLFGGTLEEIAARPGANRSWVVIIR